MLIKLNSVLAIFEAGSKAYLLITDLHSLFHTKLPWNLALSVGN